MQCLNNCCDDIWSAEGVNPDVDSESSLLTTELPRCIHCGRLARPNILMFGDWEWNERRTAEQQQRLNNWLNTVDNLVIIEIGAGTAIPNVRLMGERIGKPLIRINLAEASIHRSNHLSLATTALQGLTGIRAALENLHGDRFDGA